MWPFKCKPAETKPKPKPEPEMINFRADDDCYKRAENLWRVMGFVNDRFGNIPQMAYWLTVYRDWDREAGASETEVDDGQTDKLRKRK